jgi:hypothetical protein
MRLTTTAREKVASKMSEVWDEFNRRVGLWQEARDAERLRMIAQYHEAFRYRETQPEHQFALLTRCRNEAQRLDEPWWDLFFEYWRLATLTADLHDFARAQPLAIELMVRFSSLEGRDHPQRIAIYTNVLYTYLQVDPLGYRDELERGFAYIDEQILPNPAEERFVLLYRWTEYLRETERWDEALGLAQRFSAMVDGNRGPADTIWWRCWVLFLLCDICNGLGLVDELAGHAEEMAELSEKRANLMRTRAKGWIWRAVAQRFMGDEQAARRSYLRGVGYLKTLDSRDEICADPMARYHELGGDWKSAVGARDGELAAIEKKGMLHRSCRVQIERCRLLSKAGELTPSDLDKARAAAAQMRVPEWYLEKLACIDPGR